MNNGGFRRQNQEYLNLSNRLTHLDKLIGFVAAEVNPTSGVIAAYSTQDNIYIWPRLRELFKETLEPASSHLMPTKVITGLHGVVSSKQNILVSWSPNGKW